MAPETGLEPVTRRLIPTRRDSTIEQMFANPFGGFHGFDLALSSHRRSSRGMFFGPNQNPWAVFTCEFTSSHIGSIVRV